MGTGEGGTRVWCVGRDDARPAAQYRSVLARRARPVIIRAGGSNRRRSRASVALLFGSASIAWRSFAARHAPESHCVRNGTRRWRRLVDEAARAHECARCRGAARLPASSRECCSMHSSRRQPSDDRQRADEYLRAARGSRRRVPERARSSRAARRVAQQHSNAGKHARAVELRDGARARRPRAGADDTTEWFNVDDMRGHHNAGEYAVAPSGVPRVAVDSTSSSVTPRLRRSRSGSRAARVNRRTACTVRRAHGRGHVGLDRAGRVQLSGRLDAVEAPRSTRHARIRRAKVVRTSAAFEGRPSSARRHRGATLLEVEISRCARSREPRRLRARRRDLRRRMGVVSADLGSIPALCRSRLARARRGDYDAKTSTRDGCDRERVAREHERDYSALHERSPSCVAAGPAARRRSESRRADALASRVSVRASGSHRIEAVRRAT